MNDLNAILLKESKTVNETMSGLSRIWHHISQYDIVIITAHRQKLVNCKNSEDSNGDLILSKSENKDRNRELGATLLKLGYGVTDIDGSYIEHYGSSNSIERKEDSFFVVNLKNSNSFFDDVFKLGEHYCQDCILIKRKEKDFAQLVGTNNFSYPGYGKTIDMGQFKGGFEAEFMSRIKNRPFTFQTLEESERMGKIAIHVISENVIKTLFK